MFTIVEIESKKLILENTRKAKVDAANLALAPLQAQSANIEKQMNAIVLKATDEIGNINGQLSLLEELRTELLPKQAEATPTPPEET